MRSIITFFVRHRIWVNVLMLSVMFFGFISLKQMRYSFFPETKPDVITVRVIYPGASPSEVAEGVTLKIEETLDGTEGVDRLTSISSEGLSVVSVQSRLGADMDRLVADVKNAIDAIGSFPLDAEEPIVSQQRFRSRSLSIALYGDLDLYNLKTITDEMRDRLLSADAVSQVDLRGLPGLEFSIEVSEERLRQYNLRFDEIAQAVRKFNINLSGGKFDTVKEEILIRTWGRGYKPEDLLTIPLRTDPSGGVVALGDVAEIRELWRDDPQRMFYNDHPAVFLNIDQAAGEDILAMANVAYQVVEDFNRTNGDIQATILDDRTVPLRQRVSLLVRNGVFGALLIVLCLGFFLKMRLSFWVTLGIPFSFAGMFILISLGGLTINVISLFGMIIVVGILVDDAIVVAENIYARTERGENQVHAAINGSMEVLGPVVTSVMTTIIAFTPLFFLDGMMGKFMWQNATVVIAALIFSLVESFLILPGHLAHSRALDHSRTKGRFRIWTEKVIDRFTQRIYAPVLRNAIAHRWLVLALPLSAILLTIGLVGGGRIGLTFFPVVDGDSIPVQLSLKAGSQEADTQAMLERIEKAVWRVNEEMRGERADGADVVTGIIREIGSNRTGDSGSHAGNLNIQLLDGEARDMDSYLISARIRKEIGPLPGVQKFTLGRSGHFGKAISVSLLGNDTEQLQHARDLLAAELRNFDSLTGVSDTDVAGRRELNITLKPRALALGLTLSDLVGQIRQGFFGQEIQRLQRGHDEIRVWVRYRPEDRSSLGRLDRMRIRTPQGAEYPFSQLAEYTIDRGVTTINRLDQQQEIRVEASQSDPTEDLPPILAEIRDDVLPRVLAQVSGISSSFEGQSRDTAKTASSMKRVLPLALLGMFLLMVLVFRSWGQAALIFSLIPIGIIGAIWGHGIMGMQLSMMSLFGVIALSGIIINDSIVLVDQINRNLRLGQRVQDAVYNAGITRLRPIILTTVTTACGLAPLMLEQSRQAQFLIPMAISVAFGLIFGTVILLVILPSFYMIMNTIRYRVSRLLGRTQSQEAVEPAVRELGETIPEQV
ncbi:MAG: efflux RND transporter permease subunit [bacterium]|nr:efflux RND transporter permease subunit [bacterium]